MCSKGWEARGASSQPARLLHLPGPSLGFPGCFRGLGAPDSNRTSEDFDCYEAPVTQVTLLGPLLSPLVWTRVHAYELEVSKDSDSARTRSGTEEDQGRGNRGLSVGQLYSEPS